jgi:hypothetical protein
MSLLSLRGSRRSASPHSRPPSSNASISDTEMNYHPKDRPLTVAIPSTSSSYHPRRPTLDEILSNQSPPPWTLAAFTAYLSQNHCLETLEFTMDAKRYQQHYEKIASKQLDGKLVPFTEESIFMLGLWHRLMQAYIQPNGAREVNLPSQVRDALLSQDLTQLPPHPDTLTSSVGKVHELMQDSVLVPFLNSQYPPTNHADSNPSSTEDLTGSYDEHRLFRRSHRRNMHRNSPKSASPVLSTSTPNPTYSPSGSPPPSMPRLSGEYNQRASAPSALTQFGRTLSQSVRNGFQSGSPSSRPVSMLSQTLQVYPSPQNLNITPSSSDSPTRPTSEEMPPPPHPPSAPPVLVHEDNDIHMSPGITTTATRPMTPPESPPPNTLNSRPNPWKRMRYSFGWRKRSSDSEHDYANH